MGCRVSEDTLHYRLKKSIYHRHTRQVTQLITYLLAHKIVFGLVRVNKEFFTLRLSRTRGHPYKLLKHFNSCSIRSAYFSERVVNVWNCLSPEMIDFSSLASFRRSLEAADLGALTY